MKANRNRIFQDGRTYHITHRCHNRRFNLRFAIDRENLLKKLSCGSEKQFRKWYEAVIADKLRQDEMQRESFWSDSRVVGDYDFVLRQAKRKDRKNIVEAGSGLYYL